MLLSANAAGFSAANSGNEKKLSTMKQIRVKDGIVWAMAMANDQGQRQAGNAVAPTVRWTGLLAIIFLPRRNGL